MRRLIPLIPACAHVPGLVLAPALPRASHPPFCSHPKAHPKVPSHPDEVVTRRAGVFSLGTFPYTFCWFKPSLQCQPHRWGVTGQRVPGIKHGICVLWGNEGSLWAAPGAPEVWFHAAFVPSPIPVLPTHPQPPWHAEGMMPRSGAGSEAGSPPRPSHRLRATPGTAELGWPQQWLVDIVGSPAPFPPQHAHMTRARQERGEIKFPG